MRASTPIATRTICLAIGCSLIYLTYARLYCRSARDHVVDLLGRDKEKKVSSGMVTITNDLSTNPLKPTITGGIGKQLSRQCRGGLETASAVSGLPLVKDLRKAPS